MDPWSKGDYSQHIRKASMAMDGLPEGIPPSGRVPRQLLLEAPILKRRWRRYKDENGNSRSILGVSSAGTKYRPEGAHRVARRVPGAPWVCVGASGTLLGPWWVHSLPSLVLREASGTRIFLYNFSGIYLALLMAGKPEI